MDFQKLEVYNKAKQSHINCKQILTKIKPEKFVIDQSGRASFRIVLNIAAGSGKSSKNDRKNFFTISRASIFECVAILDILKDEGRISEDDWSFINTLAYQCPFVGGTAVYKARTLNAMQSPMAFYEDMEICNAVGVYKNGKGLFDDENALLDSLGSGASLLVQENKLTIYPNPASTVLYVEYTLLDNQQSTLQLIDISGSVINEIALPKTQQKVEIPVSHLATGMYTYKQITNGIIKEKGKLVVE